MVDKKVSNSENQVDKNLGNITGETPLHLAAENGDATNVEE